MPRVPRGLRQWRIDRDAAAAERDREALRRTVEIGVRIDGSVQAVAVHPRLLEHLTALLETGHYGRSVAEVVARLAEEGCWRAQRWLADQDDEATHDG